jgi:hypothetical protein
MKATPYLKLAQCTHSYRAATVREQFPAQTDLGSPQELVKSS